MILILSLILFSKLIGIQLLIISASTTPKTTLAGTINFVLTDPIKLLHKAFIKTVIQDIHVHVHKLSLTRNTISNCWLTI